jgi:hypothetical protein
MTLNEMKYWYEGYPFGVSIPSGVDTGEMKYWSEGYPFVFVSPASSSAPVFTPIIC